MLLWRRVLGVMLRLRGNCANEEVRGLEESVEACP